MKYKTIIKMCHFMKDCKQLANKWKVQKERLVNFKDNKRLIKFHFKEIFAFSKMLMHSKLQKSRSNERFSK